MPDRHAGVDRHVRPSSSPRTRPRRDFPIVLTSHYRRPVAEPASSVSPSPSPAPLAWFLATWLEAGVWGQLFLRRAASGRGFALGHLADREADPTTLREVSLVELRRLVQFDLAGQYRPLRSAPTLVSGWRYLARNDVELGTALQAIYPGSVPDAWALANRQGDPTRFEDVAARQLGKGKQLQELQGDSLGTAVQAGCGAEVCLKRRHWTATNLPAEAEDGKSTIPCLEPCALFLGFARTCVAMDQQPRVSAEFAPDDWASVLAAVRYANASPPRGIPDGDLAHPLNRRRLARLIASGGALWARIGANPPTTHEERD